MNEYQDQKVWIELQLLVPNWGWRTLFDVDTVEEAAGWIKHLEAEHPTATYRIKPVYGLA